MPTLHLDKLGRHHLRLDLVQAPDRPRLLVHLTFQSVQILREVHQAVIHPARRQIFQTSQNHLDLTGMAMAARLSDKPIRSTTVEISEMADIPTFHVPVDTVMPNANDHLTTR